MTPSSLTTYAVDGWHLTETGRGIFCMKIKAVLLHFKSSYFGFIVYQYRFYAFNSISHTFTPSYGKLLSVCNYLAWQRLD